MSSFSSPSNLSEHQKLYKNDNKGQLEVMPKKGVKKGPTKDTISFTNHNNKYIHQYKFIIFYISNIFHVIGIWFQLLDFMVTIFTVY